MKNIDLEYLVTSNELQDISYRSEPPEETIHPRIESKGDGPYVYCQKKKIPLAMFLARLANNEPSLRVAGYRDSNGTKVQTTISFNKKNRVSISPRLQLILNQIRVGEVSVLRETTKPISISLVNTQETNVLDLALSSPQPSELETANSFTHDETESTKTEAESIDNLLDGFQGEDRDVVAKRRVNQGKFRKSLLRYWDGRCCVSEVADERLLVASHAIPWSKATKQERGDPANGLLLSVVWDALFDRGLISFRDDGNAILDRLDQGLLTILGIDKANAAISSDKLTSRHKDYLKRHRLLFRFE